MSKEKIKIVKQTKTEVTMSIPAYSDGKLVGYTQVTVFKEDEHGLAALKAVLSLSNLKDLNRQKITDAKNNLRRGTSLMAALRQLVKVNPKVEQIVSLLANQAMSGTFNTKTLESIEAMLKEGTKK
jgi:hypothetical protein